MINTVLLKDKYKYLIGTDVKAFKEEVTKIESLLKKEDTTYAKPLVVFGDNIRDEVIFAVGTYYSQKMGKVLDHLAITSLTYMELHFEEASARDNELYDMAQGVDLLFILLNSYDTRGGTYTEAVLANLVETRSLINKATVIYADNVGHEFSTLIKRISQFQKPINTLAKPKSATAKRGRIL